MLSVDSLRNPRDIFVKDRYPTLFLTFRTIDFETVSFHKKHILELKNGRIRAQCLEWDHFPNFCYIILVHRDFFYSPGGHRLRHGLRQALEYKVGSELFGYKNHKDQSRWVGLLWTNCLGRYTPLYDKSIGDLRIWESKTLAKRDYERTVQLMSWYLTLPTHHQKNITWKEVQTTFLEYVSSVSYPFDTLQSNFQSAVTKYKARKSQKRYDSMKSNTAICTSPALLSTSSNQSEVSS